MDDEALEQARLALDRGEYGQVLRLLEPLAERHPPRTAAGAVVRMMMATALMGQGRSDRAAACCRPLLACQDAVLRGRARDLLEVLEAPALNRPPEWNLTLPTLSGAEALEGKAVRPRRRAKAAPPAPPPPPVGSTRTPRGFAAVAVALLALLLLAGLVGGCSEVRTDLTFAGPGRLRIAHHLPMPAGRPTPWQRRFAAALEGTGFQSRRRPEEEVLLTGVLPARQALDALTASFRSAGDLAGLPLVAPEFDLRERNWLVGVEQRLRLALDLRPLAPVPGLELQVELAPVRPAAVRRAEPAVERPLADRRDHRLLWRPRPGRRNLLELHCWRWSPLGLGAVAIAAALLIVLTLQRMRWRLGFGPPELPS
jgi:hypothetical protein